MFSLMYYRTTQNVYWVNLKARILIYKLCTNLIKIDHCGIT